MVWWFRASQLWATSFKPKSFAGLFGAAPWVALATLGLTVASEGANYAAIEARSMMAGAIAFFAYASFVSWIMMRYKPKVVRPRLLKATQLLAYETNCVLHAVPFL